MTPDRRIRLFTRLLISLILFLAVILILGGQVLPKQHAPILLALDNKPDSLKRFARRLAQQGGTINPTFLERSLFYARLGKPIGPGVYRITANERYYQLWLRIYLDQADYRAITIVEGWNFKQALAAITRNAYLTHLIAPNDKSEMVMQKMGHALEAPEGRFAPDTYYVTSHSTDLALLQRAYQQLTDWLTQEWSERTTDFYKCPYQALIVASLLEREVRKADELELVAGVILARLNKNMRLQIDASTIYGLGDEYDGKLTRQQLRTNASAYNTYRFYGLPPTPICLPSRRAIHAALHPKFGFLYYVAKGDGSHYFSKDFDEHNRAVRLYRRIANSESAVSDIKSK